MGILLGWKLSRLFDQISNTTSPSSPAPTSSLAPIPDQAPKPTEGDNDRLIDAPPADTPPLSSPAPVVHTTVTASPTPTAASNDETLQLAYEMAHHLGQYKAGFLARTSHELRSPLNRVMSLQQLILADLCDNPEEERDFTRQSYEAAQELLELLDQATAISKLEHGTVDLIAEDVSLVTLFSELEMQTALHAKNRNLRLSIEQPDTDIQIMTDPLWLRQVLINLVTTPIYLMDSGHIDVTHQVDSAANTLSITVTDERPISSWSEPTDLLEKKSLPQETAAKTQAVDKKSITLEQPSSAWGLSLITTTKLVEAMKGNLTILSTPNSSDDGKTSLRCSIPLS
ncbi:MAG: HAMP domain-containing histidine kinase [Okeania sp. SIO2G5]|nr:HAMP domain-containing histidine kinase [Okeania sp. SIO2G5]